MTVLAATTLTEHQLLIFWLQLLVLVGVARGLGGLMRRVGQPAVVGELAAGLVVGPSLLGRVLPDVHAYLFPPDPVQDGLLLAVSWIGVVLLLVVTGFETDLKLLSRLGRTSVAVSTFSLVVPLLLGFGLGSALPEVFLGAADQRLPFALFMAVALSISSLPVVAKILMDMGLMRRDIGQVIVAGGMANDLVGWVLLGVLAGVVTSGGFAVVGLLVTVGSIAAFLVLALTVGQRLTDSALRRARQSPVGLVSPLTVAIVLALLFSAITQALGVEAVLGAFVAGIVLGRSRYRQREIEESLEVVVNSWLAPVFFATAGLSVDLGLLADPVTLLWAVIVVAVAAVSKFIGAFIGARIGRMTPMEGLAVAIGLNARGAVEIVIATIGLGLGILNQASFTIIVVMAVATSLMAPPLLRRVLSRMVAGPDEAARLEREAMLEASVIAGTERALLPTRGGVNSTLAARLLDMAMQPDTAITVHTVHADDGEASTAQSRQVAADVERWLAGRDVERIDRVAEDPAATITAEAALGYGVLAVGMSEGFTGGHAISRVLADVLMGSPIPILLVKHGRHVDAEAETLGFARVLVPSIGTRAGLAAEEIAYTLAASTDAAVEVVHVVNRLDGGGGRTGVAVVAPPSRVVDGLLARSRTLAAKFGRDASVQIRTGTVVGPELAIAADEAGADLIVLGARLRAYAGQPFLGHGVEWLLEHSSQTVVVVVLPLEEGAAETAAAEPGAAEPA
jgi:Kef-type K+ transport system membrane component KefB